MNNFFNPIILSADIGSRKDDVKIFQAALHAVGFRGEECIFIDNQEKNLVVPQTLGFKTFFYDHTKNDIALLKRQLSEWEI